jgi:hypothetical protein
VDREIISLPEVRLRCGPNSVSAVSTPLCELCLRYVVSVPNCEFNVCSAHWCASPAMDNLGSLRCMQVCSKLGSPTCSASMYSQSYVLAPCYFHFSIAVGRA